MREISVPKGGANASHPTFTPIVMRAEQKILIAVKDISY